MIIRTFQPDDMFAVVKLAFDTLPERYNPIVFNHFYESFPEGFLVAEHHHKIIGFLVGIITTHNKAKILMIAVMQHHRRKNIGTTLLAQFLQEITQHHVNEIELEVRTTNKTAIHFYQKHGFTITDTFPKFYQNEENAYLMKKQV